MKPWCCILAVAAGSCGLVDPQPVAVRINVDFSQLLQGDYTTVAERIDLRIDSDGDLQTQSQVLGAGEFEAAFEVTVKAGDATFSADVISNNGTLLYTGSTTTNVEEDGFVVTIVPVAVNAVLLLAPGVGTFEYNPFESDFDMYIARMTIRNRGSATLTWRADSTVTLPSGVTQGCRIRSLSLPAGRCDVAFTTGPGQDQAIELQVFINICILHPSSVTLRIVSSVGTLVVPATIPQPDPTCPPENISRRSPWRATVPTPRHRSSAPGSEPSSSWCSAPCSRRSGSPS